MPPVQHNPKRNDRSLLLGLVIFFIFFSPALILWMSPHNPWYLPYLVWLGIILVTFLISRVRHAP